MNTTIIIIEAIMAFVKANNIKLEESSNDMGEAIIHEGGGYTIKLPPKAKLHGNARVEVMLHECFHIWRHMAGFRESREVEEAAAYFFTWYFYGRHWRPESDWNLYLKWYEDSCQERHLMPAESRWEAPSW
jgi:hypothetical protein